MSWHVCIAPDSFKGSMISQDAAKAIASGIKKSGMEVTLDLIPMADGGEGTVDALCTAMNATRVEHRAEDPLGNSVDVYYAYNRSNNTAIIETAMASGITRISRSELDPLTASTFGTGEQIKHALNQGAETIILGLGGSATVDGGIGCLQALGVRCLDASDEWIDRVGGNLSDIHRINLDQLDPRLKNIRMILATDVTNPLLGKKGAVSVFGPQKGISNEQMQFFENGMMHYAELLSKVTGKCLMDSSGSGAAGGLGFGLMNVLNIEMTSGFELIANITRLKERINDSDFVITGEGKLDDQSFYGKGPMGVAELAEASGIPVLLFAGSVTEGFYKGIEERFLLSAHSILHEVTSLDRAVEKAPQWLEQSVLESMKMIRFQDGFKNNKTV